MCARVCCSGSPRPTASAGPIPPCPVRSRTVRPDPALPRSVCPFRLARSRPTRSRPTRSRPARSRPARSRPARSRPARSRTVRSRTVRSRTVRSRTVRSRTVRSTRGSASGTVPTGRALPRRALVGPRALPGRALPSEHSRAGRRRSGHRWTRGLRAGRGDRLPRRSTRGRPGCRPQPTGSAHAGRPPPTRTPDGDTGRAPREMPRCGHPTGASGCHLGRTSPLRCGGARIGVARTRYAATSSSVPPGDEVRTAQAALGGTRPRPGRRARAARTG